MNKEEALKSAIELQHKMGLKYNEKILKASLETLIQKGLIREDENGEVTFVPNEPTDIPPSDRQEI